MKPRAEVLHAGFAALPRALRALNDAGLVAEAKELADRAFLTDGAELPALLAEYVTPVCATCAGTGAVDDPTCRHHTFLDGPPCAVPCPDCGGSL